MRSTRALVGSIGVVAVVLAACGDDSETSARNSTAREGADEERTIEVRMLDNEFDPVTLTVHTGETVRFKFTNNGEVEHDAFIGDASAQATHEQEMRATEEGTGGHDMSGDAGATTSTGGADMGSEASTTTAMGSNDMGPADEGITVQPGKTGRLTHTFDQPGTLEIGCHEPGHYAAGMKVKITVS
jgi:uncharacterized cupredoxin-like copper-binding protein